MHPKIKDRRGGVLSGKLALLDRDIQAICLSLAHRVRLEQPQQKWEPLLRPELRENKEIEHVGEPALAGNALAGSICLGEREADFIETRFQVGVDHVVRIPAASEQGRIARRDPIRKLIELEEVLSTLLRAPWASSETASRRGGLDRSGHDRDRTYDREYR